MCLKKDWNSPVYAFFHPEADIESTGNMCKHVKNCWGEDALAAAVQTKNAREAHETVVQGILTTGTITASFERKGKGKVTFSHHQHTKTETKAEIVHWVSESFRFQSLMKTGRLEYYIPSPSTVSRDVHLVFVQTRQQIANMLQKYEGELNFAMDAWTSPNHKAFMAESVHLEHKGKPVAMILDIVEVPKVSN
ncbi:uncharacterized protein EDB91DRAFT_1239076 [Suillus paluster]|uniref:uncharacterized protein n=1 Tax=Suillus paluster TaxID=48578 RepID=UPI001B864B03|nr:uncharacterized protein EDB91DRAFT_1239076 [Suillus paluster]KAG1730510.1 hypothetical protein EDB91DRAFT_1239076 [Suillus paluster]